VNVNDLVAERIAAARARAEATKRRRATQQAARQAGLTIRHRAKLARLDAAEEVFRGSPENPDALSTAEPTEGTTP
jgi:hypothetical protein